MDQASTLRDFLKNRSENITLNSRVIAVSSGKGGVGKSNLTLNLAIALSRLGQKVVVFDADFGLANIEILAGISPKYSFADVMNGKNTILEVVTEGPEGIHFISGGSGIVDFIKSGDMKINFIMDNFAILDKIYDIILIDTGAGVSDNVLNLIKASSEAIIISTPEPTSLTDAYALLKSVKFSSEDTHLPKINIIANKIDDTKEGYEVFNKLYNVCSSFLKIDLVLLGFVPNDYQLIKAIKKQKPALVYAPNSLFSAAVETIAQSLIEQSVSIKETSGISMFMKRLVSIFNG